MAVIAANSNQTTLQTLGDALVQIEPYSEAYKDAIAELIVNIQRNEFGLPITAADQPDLQDIDNFYLRSGGGFWLALVDGQVVGTISLLNIGDGQFALRKMFVKDSFRGPQYEVAKKLLLNAEAWAREKAARCIYLGTTERFLAAHRFYEKNGYVQLPQTELPGSFPVMAVDKLFFQKPL